MPKLLLVEDDPALQFTIQTALEANGYEVDSASTTGDAIDRLSGQAYPIVISDIYIDERTGLDILEAAKRKDPLCAVILMTGPSKPPWRPLAAGSSTTSPSLSIWT